MATPRLTVLGEELASEYAQQPALFHNSPSPAHELAKEQAWHRFALYLAAKARMSPTEIATALGKSPASVRNLFKQDWFQKQYDALVSSAAQTMYEDMLQGEDTASLLTLIELRDDPNVKSATRAACAFDILDRMKGKAVQKTLSISHNLKDPVEIDAMKKELAALELEAKSMLGATGGQNNLPNVNGVTR